MVPLRVQAPKKVLKRAVLVGGQTPSQEVLLGVLGALLGGNGSKPRYPGEHPKSL